MRLVILENPDEVATWAARYVRKRIKIFNPTADRNFVLGLPTGGTPLGMYQKLSKYHKEGQLSFRHVTTFNMDEYVGLPRDHPESYHSYMFDNFLKINDLIGKFLKTAGKTLQMHTPKFLRSYTCQEYWRRLNENQFTECSVDDPKHIDIDPNCAHILDGNAANLESECSQFENKMASCGGVELFIGGIGPDGHIAFNEPGSSLVSRTRVKTLAEETIQANARFFGGQTNQVPYQALTVGVGTVMDAREVMILITGAAKSLALHKAIEGGVNHMWTVSAFQQHPRTIFVVDEDATMELKVKTVKYFKGLSEVHNKLLDD